MGVVDSIEHQDHKAPVDDTGPFDEPYRCLQLYNEHVQIDLSTD
jgi:hypothetical protein